MTPSLLTPTGHVCADTAPGMPEHPASSGRAGGGGSRVLVLFASRHGATREIAAALARQLPMTDAAAQGALSVHLAPVQQHPDPAAFDAVVLGSAVYGGRWLTPAVSYAEATAEALGRRPTWLFSSGVADQAVDTSIDGGDGRRVGSSIGSRDHRFFPGRLESRLLSAVERRLLTGRPAPAGDHRDWAAVSAWAEEIASGLAAARTPTTRHEVA